MNSKSPSVMKSTAKAGAGGAIVVAAVLALLFFRGGGGPPGSSGDGSPELAEPSLVNATSPPANSENVPETPPVFSEPSGGLTADEELALSGKVLAILVDERSYFMAVPTDNDAIYRPAELQRLLELAQLAEGDSNGIRIRILQRESARISAKTELEARLADLGIGTDAVYTQSEFIP